VQIIEYSPVVVLLCNNDTLEFENLCYLAERVGGFSLSFELTVVSAAVDL
jgi:hypothetical protein